jgi:hypothetical protein
MPTFELYIWVLVEGEQKVPVHLNKRGLHCTVLEVGKSHTKTLQVA